MFLSFSIRSFIDFVCKIKDAYLVAFNLFEAYTDLNVHIDYFSTLDIYNK